MKRILTCGITAFFAYISFFPNLIAQDPDPTQFAIVFDYMKAKPNSNAIGLEQSVFQPIHQEMVNNGQKIVWYCFEVLFPSGSNVEYNYVTVNVYPSLKAYLEPSGANWGEIFKKVHPGKDMDIEWNRISKARDWVKTEMYTFIDEAVPGPPEEMADYLHINFFDAADGMADEYVAYEQKYFKPMHAAAVAAGSRLDWGLYSLAAPAGEETGYTHFTVDLEGSIDHLMTPPPAGLWETVHPGVDQDEVWEKMASLRTLVRRDLWRSAGRTVAPAGN